MLPFSRTPSWRTFFERDFEQRIVHSEQAMADWRQALLPGREEVFELLKTGIFRDDDVLVLRDGTGCDQSVYMSSKERGRIDAPAMMRLYLDERCTIYVRSIQLYSMSVRTWVERLENYLSPIQINVNAFLTPANAVGLVRHVDAHDTIIVQREGEKNWRIWLDSIPMNEAGAAKRESKYMDQNPPSSQASVTLQLCAGDVLYVPRGAPHQVKAGVNTHSLHYNIWLRSPIQGDSRFNRRNHANEPYPTDIF